MARKLFSITKKDLRIDTFKCGGKGGQKQNKTDSGVRITHLASGISHESREERSQRQNKKKALRGLVADPKFRLWVKLYASVVEQGYRDVEHKVDEMLNPKNLKIEYL